MSSRYAVLGLAILAFIAAVIGLLGAIATFTRTKRDDPWARRIKEGYYWAWVRVLRLAMVWKRWRREAKEEGK